MTVDLAVIKREASQALRADKGITALMACIAKHFLHHEVYRENDDLIVKHARRFLIVKRTGPDHFRITENIAVPSTNIVDAGGGADRDIDSLIDELAELQRG
jgi:hypothetical protein